MVMVMVMVFYELKVRISRRLLVAGGRSRGIG